MSEENKVLDLDELFGQSKVVKMRMDGIVYEFVHIETFSPRELVQLNQIHLESVKLQKEMNKKSNSEDEGRALSDQIESLMNQILNILCPKFPADKVAFARKSAVIKLYMGETQGKNVQQAALKRMTGAKRSRA